MLEELYWYECMFKPANLERDSSLPHRFLANAQFHLENNRKPVE